MSQKFAYIGRDKNVSWNQPIILGSRLTVYNVITGINGDGLEYIDEHELNLNVIKEALNYCSTLECQKDKNGNFCDGCVLNSLKNGWKVNKNDFKEINKNGQPLLIHTKTDSIFMGDMKEYEEQSFGRIGWKIAEDVKEQFSL